MAMSPTLLNSWKYLCLAGCGHGYVDIRKLKLRSRLQHACWCSLYEVAFLTAGLHCATW